MNENKLEEFLTSRGLLERFKNNYLKDKVHAANSCEKFLDWYGSKTGAISSAFTWSRTPEGIDFWETISNEWVTIFVRNEL